MSLLDRIAHSNGDPQRTMRALRLINKRLRGETQILKSLLGFAHASQDPKQSLAARLKYEFKENVSVERTGSEPD